MPVKIDLQLTRKQKQFVDATEDEVLYGGAAGGGKSYAQIIDAMLKALQYPGIKQLILRRTFPELEKSLIRLALTVYPKDIYRYNASSHTMFFHNGSLIDFGYCQAYEDAMQYQSLEYDIIRFDELTHFDPDAYTYLITRNRGVNQFPKQIKSSTNPGNRGHKFVKARFIDGHAPLQPFKDDLERTYKFIPALVTENKFLMQSDPLYVKRLEQLPQAEREALLNGSWSSYTGMAFPEFNYNIHTCDPFEIPKHWRRWIACDNGYTDPFWWGWFTVDPDGIVYLYREFTRSYDDPKLLYTEQAQKVIELMTHTSIDLGEVTEEREKIDYIVAGVDAWNKHHRDQTGKDLIDMYGEGGLSGFVKAITDRKLRKSMFHEYLKPLGDHPFMKDKMGNPKPYSKLQIFRTCTGIISDLPDLIEDEKNPEMYADCSFDHCLTADTLVDTVDGQKPISELVDTTGQVYCFDEETKQATTSTYYDVRQTAQNVDVYEIEMEDGRTFRATSYHPVLTDKGWKVVSELCQDDAIIDIMLPDRLKYGL